MDRKLFDRYYKLLPKQSWLVKKEFELMKMISSCKTSQQKDLLFNLLEDFQYLNNDILNRYIESIATAPLMKDLHRIPGLKKVTSAVLRAIMPLVSVLVRKDILEQVEEQEHLMISGNTIQQQIPGFKNQVYHSG